MGKECHTGRLGVWSRNFGRRLGFGVPEFVNRESSIVNDDSRLLIPDCLPSPVFQGLNCR